MTGRTLGADADDISGTVTIAWAVDGEVLMFTGDQTIQDFHVASLEVVWGDEERDDFPAHVYTGNGSAPLNYRWAVEDGEFVHAGLGATYRGTLSEDSSTLSGGWRPDPGSEATDESAYDAVMHRIG